MTHALMCAHLHFSVHVVPWLSYSGVCFILPFRWLKTDTLDCDECDQEDGNMHSTSSTASTVDATLQT